jgi:thymidylate synthase
MRIFSDPYDAAKEVERDLWEMGITVHPQTMQDKVVKDNPDYATKEMQGYAFKITDWAFNTDRLVDLLKYFFPNDWQNITNYCLAELQDRVCGKAMNPGCSYLSRPDVWNEFLHDGKFAYTYSERMHDQVGMILQELRDNPDTRRGIINIHSYISPLADFRIEDTGQEFNYVDLSADANNRGGGGRIPCSMYYQMMIRNGKVDLIYTMRSCDLLTHFPIDLSLALMLQNWFAHMLHLPMGTFTYFAGSLHSYFKDMKSRGIF